MHAAEDDARERLLKNFRPTRSPKDFDALYNGKPFEDHKVGPHRCIREAEAGFTLVHVQAMHRCHLCSVAARLNREISGTAAERIVGDELAVSFWARNSAKVSRSRD